MLKEILLALFISISSYILGKRIGEKYEQNKQLSEQKSQISRAVSVRKSADVDKLRKKYKK